MRVQKEQDEQLKLANKETDYEKKIRELQGELRAAKEHLRNLQVRQREEERDMRQ